jgi:hypothetical protein
MQYKGRAEAVAQEIIEAFQRGDIPEALANVFIHRNVNSPSNRWSWSNRLLVALCGHCDARGFRQWQAVGRNVRKGERAFHILGPCIIKAKKDDEERGIRRGDPCLIGFTSVPVFGYSQTEGDPLPELDQEARFLESLPFVAVARSWQLSLTTFNGDSSPRAGYYRYGMEIGLGVENLSTWAHELIHAADHRIGTLTTGGGQRLDNEIVAELGGAVLLECIGYQTDSDRGGCWRYIDAYAKRHQRNALSVCTELLDRTAACVALILETADQLASHSGCTEKSERNVFPA